MTTTPARQRLLDLLRPGVCLLIGVTMFAIVAPRLPFWNLLLSFAIGCIGVVALAFHRRYPKTATAVCIAAAALTPFATPSMWMSLFLIGAGQALRVTVCLLVGAVFSHVFLTTLYIVRWNPADVGQAIMIGMLSTATTVTITVIVVVLGSNRVRTRAAAADLLTATARADVAGAQERERLTQEVHDNVGYRLALLSIFSHSLDHYDELSPAEQDEVRGHLREQIDQAGSALATAVAGTTQSRVDVDDALDELVAGVRAAGVPLTYARERALSGVSPQAGALVVRFVREGLTNALKHGGEGRLQVHIFGEGPLTAEVVSPAGQQRAAGSGLGLAGLREASVALGGTFQFDRGENQVRMTLVLPAAAELTGTRSIGRDEDSAGV